MGCEVLGKRFGRAGLGMRSLYKSVSDMQLLILSACPTLDRALALRCRPMPH